MNAWSYSSLTAFETCPRRYELTRISKKVTEPQTEATLHGNEVHKALERSVKDAAPLPEKYKAYIPIVDAVKAAPGVKHAELKFGLTKSFTPTGFFSNDVWCRGVLDLSIVQSKSVTVVDWKGLALDTPLPTPTGFTTMAEVREGDKLYDMHGAQCTVVGKSEVHNRPCFRVTFDDTSSVVCDDEHLWQTTAGVVRTTELTTAHKVPVAAPIETRAAELPIDPYVLGLWIADGKHTSGEVSKPDAHIWRRVESLGYELGNNTGRDGCQTRTIKGIRKHLTDLGVRGNKHIPDVYMRASIDQRIQLVQGLMDGDGSVNAVRKQVVFSNCNKRLSEQVKELALSLGQRPLLSTVTASGFGKTVSAYPVSWRPLRGTKFFSLPRKADRQAPEWGEGMSGTRRVVAVEPVPSVPTQCISVDSPTRTYLCTRSFIPTHNTGKPKTDGDQLRLFAAAAFALYPFAETVRTGYAWLAYNKLDTDMFKREQVPELWQTFLPRVERMNHAIESGTFPPKPSGLCKAWCPVPRSMCEFSGKV